jgi:hypothetical protein
MFSMMSISPQAGHDTFSMSSPRSQNAGPHALTARQFDPSGKAAISLKKDRARYQPGRRVLTGDSVLARIVLAARFDDQLALVNAGVLGTIRVVLEFVISPAVAGNFELPP